MKYLDKYISALENLTNNSSSYDLPKNELTELIKFMIENIGNTNSYIRDSLIYAGFCELIINEKITLEQSISILKTCIDEQHLYLNIHTLEKNDDVFVRSFSVLVIDLILIKDIELRRLPNDLIIEALEKGGNYLNFETDYRGYVSEKGWAHSVAHGSDLLTRVILHPLSDEVVSISHCLNTIKKCLSTDYAYIDDEDERILAVIDALFVKGLSDEDLKVWLMNLHDVEENDELKKYRIQWNIKKFTLTLYTYLLRIPTCTETSDWIYTTYISNKIE